MFELLDVVRVKKEYPELSLTPKIRGTIVDVHNGGEAYTVEFIDEKGETIEKALYREFTESELEYVVTKLYCENASLELRIKEAKKFFGLRPDQSFQDLDVEVDDDEEIIHGLDLPDEISEKNNRIVMKQLGITEANIENCEIDDEDYLCNQEKDIEILNTVRNMTDEEFDKYQCEALKKEYLPFIIVDVNENVIGFKSDAPINAKRAVKEHILMSKKFDDITNYEYWDNLIEQLGLSEVEL